MSRPFRARYARDPASSARARADATRHFAGLPGDTGHALALVVSELVTNAVRHGEGAVEVRLDLHDGEVRGEVIDEGPGFEAEMRDHAPDQTGGRGLAIVDHLAAEWGVFDGSSHVWFHLPVAGPDDGPTGATLGEPAPGGGELPDR